MFADFIYVGSFFLMRGLGVSIAERNQIRIGDFVGKQKSYLNLKLIIALKSLYLLLKTAPPKTHVPPQCEGGLAKASGNFCTDPPWIFGAQGAELI